MTAIVRPRRSVLYMPGANTRALEKARLLPADALIFDLEDAVAPDAKEVARANVVAAAQSKAYGKREIVIRSNGLSTEWGRADVAAIAASGADAILVPKLESAADVANVVALLDAAGAPASMAVWGMM
ncbi:MAG: CoA ester lyase, partial [Alphaproteobacteria bacterium]|nr:CoA ester lyase [Alphaproteobacteria bacterium]